MKRRHEIVFILLFLLPACRTPDEPVLTYVDFFPLQVGNKWYYNTSGSETDSLTRIWEITAQKEFDGKIWYERTNLRLPFRNTDTAYYRFSGDILFVKDRFREEEIIADFSLRENEYAYWDSHGDLRVTQKTESVITFARPFSADYGSSVTYRRGAGITEMIQNGFIYYQFRLVRAELKSTMYVE